MNDDVSGLFLKQLINVGNKIVKKCTDTMATVINSMSKTFINQRNAVASKQEKRAENKNKMPTKSEPNTTQKNPNGNVRVFGPDGKAVKDVDWSHPEHHPSLGNPHVHDWNNGERGKARKASEEETLIKIAVGVGAGYILYRGVRLLPSLIPGFWWTAPINLAIP